MSYIFFCSLHHWANEGKDVKGIFCMQINAKNKKILYYGFLGFMAFAIGIASIGEGENGPLGFLAANSPTAYSISFDKNINKIGTEAFSPSSVHSGTGYATTGLGNKVTFEYNQFYNPTNAWQIIKTGGYFTNISQIAGMKSIKITKGSQASCFKVYWSETTNFTETNSQTYDSTSALTFECDFANYYPNYLKVVSNGTSNSSIANALITFSCSNSYPMLSVTSNDIEKGTVSEGGIHKIGSNVTVTGTAKSGYKLSGWYHHDTLLSTSSPYSFTMPDCQNNYEIEGRFIPESYNLVLASEDAEKGSVSGGGYHDFNSSVSISATANPGYTFQGWYDGDTLVSANNPYVFTMPNDNLSYVARFSINSYTMTINTDQTRGTITGSGTYIYKSQVTLTATELSGYLFAGWYDGTTLISNNNPYVLLMPAMNLTYEAKFLFHPYTLTIATMVPDGLGAEVTTSGAGSYEYQSPVTISASVNEGFELAGWYEETTLISTNNPYTFSMPNKNTTYTAKIQQKSYTVNLTKEGGNYSIRLIGSGTAKYKNSVTIYVYGIENGYAFVGWYDGTTLISSEKQYTFLMPDHDVSYVAKFTLGTYTLTLSSKEIGANPVGSCAVSGQGEYVYTSSITIKATPESGYGFLGWYEAQSHTLVERDTWFTFTMPGADTHYVAEYSKLYHVNGIPFDENKGSVIGAGDRPFGSTVTLSGNPASHLERGINWYDSDLNLLSSNLTYQFVMPEKDVTIYAEFLPLYTAQFKNYDGTLLQTVEVNQNVTPVYSEATPIKIGGPSDIYTFSNWSPAIAPLTANTTYVAQFERATPSKLPSFFMMGKYPQSVVTDATLLTALSTAVDSDSDGYLEYDNKEYKKYTTTDLETYTNWSMDKNTSFTNGNTYYFNVEAIKWKTLSGQGTTSGLVTSVISPLNGCFYTSQATRTINGQTIYPNNYQYSTLRAQLNGYNGSSYGVENFSSKGFIDVAFSAQERALITTTAVDNSVLSTSRDPNIYTCDNTNDKIFALSIKEFTDLHVDAAGGTDYISACGAYPYLRPYFWTRSPDSQSSTKVFDCASSWNPYDLTRIRTGIRPAFNISIA